jgi:deazaflavin-dependent oxidoreductase (nitroreductase family)
MLIARQDNRASRRANFNESYGARIGCMKSIELARLRRVAGKKTTRLTHYGRRTGKPYEVTIWFVLDTDRLYIGTANVKRQWVKNVQKTPNIKMTISNEPFVGTARFLNDRVEHERAMAAIRRKYWIFRPIIEVGRILAAAGLMRDNTGSFEITIQSNSSTS